jgi:hypothetical protein
MNEAMYDYYRRQTVLPTEGGLTSPSQLEALEQERRRLFTDKLGLPPGVFREAQLLEVGPDAGGNSIVFATWGARCTLAEPNPKAHARIIDAFDRFGLREQLVDLLPLDVDGLPVPPREDRFDIVDAEGFIYTVQPPARWLRKFAELVCPEGFVVVTYYEPVGAFFELLWKVVHARYREASGKSGTGAAEDVFGTKWRSIPHRRSLESWTMDVLENPFVRASFFLEPGTLLAAALADGFAYHSSWPRYESGFEVGWLRRADDPEQELARRRDFIVRSRLSYLLGRSHFRLRADESLDRELLSLVLAVDRLIDGWDSDALAECRAGLDLVDRLAQSEETLATTADREHSLATVASIRRLLDALETGSTPDLVSFCNKDAVFIGSWGAPNHFLVLRRLAGG